MKRIGVTLAVLLFAVAGHAEDPRILEMELRLIHGMGPGGVGAAGSGTSLLIDVTQTGDRWERVWGINSRSRMMHFFTGCVTKAEVSSDHVVLDMLLRLKGVSRVHVDVEHTADGTLKGTYTVTSGSETVKGEADGRVKPGRPPLPSGFVQVQPGERPRILFRKSDTPALKKKLASPLGKVLFEKMGDETAADAIGAGIKYQLTGDRKFADEARALATMQMAGQGGQYSSRTSKGRRPKQVSVAYDLCHDAWPEDFKKRVVEYMVKTARETIAGHGMGGNKHVCSNWWAKPYSALAFIGLALWGEKGPMPPKPGDPNAQDLLMLWEFDVAEWKRLGKVNMEYQRIFETGRQLMYWHCREGVGTGGFRGECAHYGVKATEMPAEYAPCYRGMFGRDVSPYNDMTYLLPRQVFCHYYPERWEPFGEKKGLTAGKPVPLDINGGSQIWGNYFASLYPITPEKWRPAMLWAWNRQFGITGPEGAAKMLTSRNMDEHGTGYAAGFFVGYPLDAKPQHPAESMPLTWQAPDFGYYGFRSSWEGRGDFVLNVFAKAQRAGGWNGPNAGTFRLFGLGQMWNETYSGRDGWPEQENRVMLPEDTVNAGGCGRVIHSAVSADGSGSLTIDMNDVYCAPSKGLYSMYANVRYPTLYKDNGIRALRALAVDYSGKSGAPCLFVLVDRIRGGKSKVWTWNLGHSDVVKNVKVISSSTFAVRRGDAVFQGTFAAPVEVKVEAKMNEVTRTAYRGKKETRKVPSILARGGDDFFLVATIQAAEDLPPPVKVEGTGLAAKVTVGGRTIRFDGKRVLIE